MLETIDMPVSRGGSLMGVGDLVLWPAVQSHKDDIGIIVHRFVNNMGSFQCVVFWQDSSVYAVPESFLTLLSSASAKDSEEL